MPTDFSKDFNFLGITLREWPDEMVGKFAGKKLVICAGAACVWDDLALLNVRDEQSDTHIMAINDIVMHLPMRIRHVYSNDHRMLPCWIAARRPLYVREYGSPAHVHSNRLGARYNWPWPGHGSSLLGGVYTGLALGYDRIVICGGPLDDSPSYFSPPWVPRNFQREVGTKPNGDMMYWQRAQDRCFKNRVRSMSGRTMELLGRP